MPLYRNKDRIVLFVHIPKTGGSTVEEVLRDSGAAQSLKYHKLLGFSNSTPQHMTWEILQRWVPAGFYDYAFAVVRHPTNRLVSEYHYRISLSETPLPPFESWVNQKLNRFKEYPYVNDNHIRPQAAFIGNGVEVFKMEDGLDKPIHTALDQLGLPRDAVPIHHARKSDPSMVELSERGLERVIRFYKRDFDAFEYDPTALPRLLKVTASPPDSQEA